MEENLKYLMWSVALRKTLFSTTSSSLSSYRHIQVEQTLKYYGAVHAQGDQMWKKKVAQIFQKWPKK